MSRSSSNRAPLRPALSMSIRPQSGWGALGPSGRAASPDLDALQTMSREDKDTLRASLDCLLAPPMLKWDARPLGARQSSESLHATSGLISALAGQPAFEARATPPASESRLRSQPVSAVGMRASASALPNMQAELVALGRFEGSRASSSNLTSLRPSASCGLRSTSWSAPIRQA